MPDHHAMAVRHLVNEHLSTVKTFCEVVLCCYLVTAQRKESSAACYVSFYMLRVQDKVQSCTYACQHTADGASHVFCL